MDNIRKEHPSRHKQGRRMPEGTDGKELARLFYGGRRHNPPTKPKDADGHPVGQPGEGEDRTSADARREPPSAGERPQIIFRVDPDALPGQPPAMAVDVFGVLALARVKPKGGPHFVSFIMCPPGGAWTRGIRANADRVIWPTMAGGVRAVAFATDARRRELEDELKRLAAAELERGRFEKSDEEQPVDPRASGWPASPSNEKGRR